MAIRLFADQPVRISKLPSFRAEHFPDSGPHPWLDRPDASDRIDLKLQHGEITRAEAEQCRYWAANGYVILQKLVENRILDEVWSAYEKAIHARKITLQPEPAAE